MIIFKQSIFVDIFTISSKPALHVVGKFTQSKAACWLPTFSTSAIWISHRHRRTDTYLGPPDLIKYDMGKRFISAATFPDESDLIHIAAKQLQVESPNSLTYVERYHDPIRKALKFVKTGAPDLDDGVSYRKSRY